MRGQVGALAAMDEAGMRALQRAKKTFAWPRMKSGGALPATSRGYDCMDAGGRAKQDARAESPSHRHRNIHRTVGGASAARLSIASSANSEKQTVDEKRHPPYAQRRRNAGAKRRGQANKADGLGTAVKPWLVRIFSEKRSEMVRN